MSLPLKFLCKKSKIKKDGTSVIKLQYCYSSEKRTELDTGIPIPPRYWNKKSEKISLELPGEFGDAKPLNEELDRMFRVAEDVIKYALKNKVADVITFVKNTFAPDFNPENLPKNTDDKPEVLNPSFMAHFEQYIKLKMRDIQDNSGKLYTSLRRSLYEYEKIRNTRLMLDTFNEDVLADYIYFLTYEYQHSGRNHNSRTGIMQNTMHNYLGRTCGFLCKMEKKGFPMKLDKELFIVPKEEADAVYLDWDEISTIYHLKIKNKKLRKTRDLFVLGCLTGLRFSDFTTIDRLDVKNGFIRKKTEKTDTWVHIPIRPECKKILEGFDYKIPKVINWTFNRHVKTIGKLAGLDEEIRFSYKKGKKDIAEIKPKYEWLGSHTARRSFCTNEYIAGTPVELIMKISGHKSLANFYRYIRIGGEEAGKKIQEIWLSRNKRLRKPRKRAA